MALSTTNLAGDYDFTNIAKVFLDFERTLPVTANDGSQTVLGVTDDSPLGRNLGFNVGVPYTAIGGTNTLAFSGAQYSDRPFSANPFTGANLDFSFDFVVYFPSQTMTGSQVLFAMGDNSNSARFSLSYQAPASGQTTGLFAISNRTDGGGTPLTATFPGWEFDKLQVVTIQRKNGGAILAYVDGVQVAVTQATLFSNGNAEYDYFALGANRHSSATSGTAFWNGNILRMRGQSSTVTGTAKSDAEVLADHQELWSTRPTIVAQPLILRSSSPYLRGISSSNPVMPVGPGSVQNVTGTPASLWARVYRVSDNVEVKALANTGATFSGTDFTGGQITAIPPGGPYQIEYQVRDAGGATLATITGNHTFVVGKKVLMIGSSTPERMGYENLGAADADNALYQANVGSPQWAIGGSHGLGVRRIAAKIKAAFGEPAIIVDGAVGGTTLGSWSTAGASGASVAIAAINLTGTDFDGLVMGVGANDSFKPYDGTTNRVRSKEGNTVKLNTVRDLFLTTLGKTDIPTVVMGANNRLFDADQPIGSDGSARATMTRGSEITFTRRLAKGLYVSSMDCGVTTNDIHLTQDGSQLLGDRTGDALAIAMGPTMSAYHPRITTAEIVAGGAEVTIQHTTGNDLIAQPTAGYSGFRVYDDTGALVYDSEVGPAIVTKVSATKVLVPFAVDPAKAYTIAHQNGTWTKPQANILKDNNGLAVEPTITAVGEVLVGGQRVTITNV